jgi:hypothetical protein
MNEDDFLRRFWQAPDPAFAIKLKQELTPPPVITIRPFFAPIDQTRRTLNILALVLAVVVVLSPDARSRLVSQPG